MSPDAPKVPLVTGRFAATNTGEQLLILGRNPRLIAVLIPEMFLAVETTKNIGGRATFSIEMMIEVFPGLPLKARIGLN